jgi:hypothetical protein
MARVGIPEPTEQGVWLDAGDFPTRGKPRARRHYCAPEHDSPYIPQGESMIKRILSAVAVLLFFAGFSIVAFGQQATTSNQSNKVLPLQAHADLGRAAHGPAIQVNMSDVPTGVPRNVLPPPEPRGGISEEEYEARKAEAAKGFALAPGGAKGAAPAGLGLETPFASPVFPGQGNASQVAPADMALAVSSSYVVQLVNESIAVYNKSGVLQAGFPKPLATFFANNSGDIGDVRAFYDWNANRFVVLADDFTRGTIHLASSATSSPLGAWHQYAFNVWGSTDCRVSGAGCPDFPQLGYDDTTIYIGINFFPGAGGISDYMLLLPKAKIYSGAGFGFNFWFNLSFGGTLVDTVHPSVPVNASEHPRAGIAVNTFNINFGGGQCRTGCNGLVFWAFSNNLQGGAGNPGPELSAVGIGTANNYFFPPNANEPGCAGCVDTNDPRISATPTYHDGIITGATVTNGNGGGAGTAHVLWFQSRVFLNDNDARCTGAFLNTCPQITGAQLLNEDCYFCGGQGAAGSSFFGALAPNTGGDLTMIFNYADNNTFVETAYTSRRATQAQNTMHDNGLILCTGSSAAVGRWGDYEADVADLSAGNQNYTWFSGMNAVGGGNWGTCIGRDGFTNLNQP